MVRPFRACRSVLLLVSLAAAVASGAGWLLLLAAAIDDRPLSDAVADGTAWIVLTQTRFGFDWQVRFLLAALLSTYVLLKPSLHSPWLDFLAALGGIAFLAMLAWAGHGGATAGSGGYVHLTADLFHLSAAGIWLGGLIPLVLLLRLLRHYDEPEWARIAATAANRFSNIGMIAVGTLLVSGMINAWFLIGRTVNLTSTDYGRLLGLKIVLFVGMVAVAAVNRLHLMPQFCRAGPPNLMLETTRRLEWNAIVEVAVGLSIICIVAVLGITPPATEVHIHVH